MAPDVLAGLSVAQADAVREPAMPTAIIAGPGAGKTRVLTRRIAWRCRTGDAEPGRTLALTFSRRAAGELRARLGALGLPTAPRDGGLVAGTFHAVAWAQVSRWRAESRRPPLGLLKRRGDVARGVLADAVGREAAPGEVRAFLDEVGWARRQGATPATYGDMAMRAGRWAPWPLEVVGAAWAAYAHAKARRLVLDLDDLLDTAAAMIEDDVRAAEAVRWRHRHVYVDEYQDLNPAHLRLLRAWVGGRADLCVVGDPRQAVYGFNGACPDLFGRLEADWPGVTVVRLAEDFRSTPELVAFTQSVPGIHGARESRRPPGPTPVLVRHRTEEEEADWIAASAWAAHRGGRGWARMAVLARTNARLHVIAAALTRAGVPWRLRDPRPLSDRPAVAEWLDQLPGGVLLRDVRVSADDPELAGVGTALDEFRAHWGRATVAAFRAWLDASGTAEDEPPVVGVDLATFHRAKGIEWDRVWVAGVEEGLVPLASVGATEAGAQEECRLLYVALTRAGEELAVSWAGEPSPWVAALASAAAELARRPGPEEQRSRLAALRSGLKTEEAGAGLGSIRRAALLAWRRARARAATVPPELVLPDAVLSSIVSSGAETASEVVRAMPGAPRRISIWAPEIAAALASGRTAPEVAAALEPGRTAPERAALFARDQTA